MEKRRVRVKPGNRSGPLVVVDPDGALTVVVRERAVDGAANEAIIRALAAHLDVPASWLAITAGRTSRTKTITITRR